MRATVYRHPDGYGIEYELCSRQLEITDGEHTIKLPIGPIGLLEVIEALAGVATTELKIEFCSAGGV
jgi:hypothetical protein